MQTAIQSVYRTLLILTGLLLFLGGAVMIFLPGPGLVFMLAGLTLLARRFAWAARLLAFSRKKAEKVRSYLAERRTSPF